MLSWFFSYFQHPPGSFSNTYQNQTISYLSVVLFLWQLDGSPHSAPPHASVPSSRVCYCRWGQFRGHQQSCGEWVEEKWESRSKGLWELQICWLTVFHVWNTKTWIFLLSLFFSWFRKCNREEKAASSYIFGTVGGFLTVQLTRGLELLLKRLSRTLCTPAIGTFCSGCSVKPMPDTLHMLRCFSKGYFSSACFL